MDVKTTVVRRFLLIAAIILSLAPPFLRAEGTVWRVEDTTTAPAFIQERGGFGLFDVMVREDGQLCKYNKIKGAPWAKSCIGGNVTSSPALIQSNYGTRENLEVVVREDDRLCHYWRNTASNVQWFKTDCFGRNITSAPALIQSNFGRRGSFEVVARVLVQDNGKQVSKLCHWWRNNDKPGYPWSDKPTACFGENITSAPALIQSNFGRRGSFEVVARVLVQDNGKQVSKLCHWWRNNDKPGYPWSDKPTACFGENITSAPALIQSNFGRRGSFEVVVREEGQLCHYWRANDKAGYPWSTRTACFGANMVSAPALIQGNYGDRGNFEVVVREAVRGKPNTMRRYWRENDKAGYPWRTDEELLGPDDHVGPPKAGHFEYVKDESVNMYQLRHRDCKYIGYCDLSDKILGAGAKYLKQINRLEKRDIYLSFPNGHPKNPKAIVFLTTGHQKTCAEGGDNNILTGQQDGYKEGWCSNRRKRLTLKGNSLYGRLKKILGIDDVYYILVHDNAAQWGDPDSEFIHSRFARYIAAKVGVRTEFVIVAGFSRGGYLAAHVGKLMRSLPLPNIFGKPLASPPLLRPDVQLYVGIFDGVSGGGSGFGVDPGECNYNPEDCKDNPIHFNPDFRAEETKCWKQVPYTSRQNNTFYFNEVGGEHVISGAVHALACRNYEAFPSFWTERWVWDAHAGWKTFKRAAALLDPFVKWFVGLRSSGLPLRVVHNDGRIVESSGRATVEGFGSVGLNYPIVDYHFHLREGGQLSFWASWPPREDLDILVFDPDGALVAEAKSRSHTSESVKVQAGRAGPYHVRVYGSPAASTTFNFLADMESDHTTTGVIHFPRELLNVTSASGYRREYNMPVGHAEPSAISVGLAWAESKNDNLALYIEDPSGNPVAGSPVGLGEYITAITYEGTYTIIVESLDLRYKEYELRGLGPLYNSN